MPQSAIRSRQDANPQHQDTVRLCNQGLHFCEHPLETWNYYRPLDGSRYAEVEGDGVSDKSDKDSKRVAQSLTVKAEVKIPALLKAAVEFVFKKVMATTAATTLLAQRRATTLWRNDGQLNGRNNDGHPLQLTAQRRATVTAQRRATTPLAQRRATPALAATTPPPATTLTGANDGRLAAAQRRATPLHSATTGDLSFHDAQRRTLAYSATTGNSLTAQRRATTPQAL